jgi:hypothetical protein
LCNFISQQITHLPDSKSFLGKIINYLNSKPDSSTDDFEENSFHRQHVEKEQTFLNLLESNVLTDYFSYDELLEMSQNSNCFQAAQFIFEKLKRYDEIFQCFLQDKYRRSEVFNYILEFKNDDNRKIYQQIVENFACLIELDARKIANILVDFYPICIPKLRQSLSGDEKLMFLLLKNLVDLGFQLEVENYDRYLELLCQFEPEKVLDYLETNQNYEVESALKIVESFNLNQPLIYMYEKNCEYKKAFDLALGLLKESPESVAESQALQVSSLCFRASHNLNESDREFLWFELIKEILTRSDLNNIVKNVLLVSGNFVDLTRLVQLIMDICDGSKSFGDIKHILTGMLTNFEYESLLLQTTARIQERDLNGLLVKEKMSCMNGIYVKSLKCGLCNAKLLQSMLVEEKPEDQVIVFSVCGHSVHNSCFQKEFKNQENYTIKCFTCHKSIPEEIDSFYLNPTIVQEDTSSYAKELNLRVPARKGI